MLVRHVADQAVCRSNPQAEALEGEDVSRNASELDSASLHKTGVARLPEMLKPTPVAKQRVSATTGLLGVTGDSGRQQTVKTSGRPTRQRQRQSMPKSQQSVGINNDELACVGVGEGNTSQEAA